MLEAVSKHAVDFLKSQIVFYVCALPIRIPLTLKPKSKQH